MSVNVITGFSGTSLTQEEIDLFSKYKPIGYVLFKRNVESKEQLLDLTSHLKEISGPNTMIFIDQEGGKVSRIKPPLFRELISSEELGKLYDRDLANGVKLVYLHYYLIGLELKSFGINGNFAPVADIRYDGASDVIGSRSFGDDANKVFDLASAAYRGLKDSGVIPVIKHIPGHGRALSDSHEELPVVTDSLPELEETDFRVFKQMSFAEAAMTAHVVYKDISHNYMPATTSKETIDYIRNELGFKNILISDSLSMKALTGTIYERAKDALEAGIDILLDCDGKMDEMKQTFRAALDVSQELNNKLQMLYDIAAIEDKYANYEKIMEEYNYLV